MIDRDKAINDLNVSKLILCNHQQTLTPEMCVRIGQAINSAIALLKEQETKKLGRWKQVLGNIAPSEETQYFECAACGGTWHLYGEEHPKRKIICDICGNINIYPWEKAYEEGSSLWVADDTYKR